MSTSHIAAPAFLLAALVSPLAAGITFKPLRAQAGESIRLVTHSETDGGTIQQSFSGKVQNGSIIVTRDRELIWTFRDPSPDGTRRGMVRVPGISTTTETVINGKEDKKTDISPLSGKMFAMSKTPTGDWKFELDGSVPLLRVKDEIEELKVYLKRDWFPTRELQLGDSWEFDPVWIKSVIHRDLADAQTIGTMSLRQIRKARDFEVAVIDVSILSTGAKFSADGTESEGAVNLKGQITVNLKTMLDELLELKGTIVSKTGNALDSTTVTLPIHLKATKSFVRNTDFDN